MQSTDARVLIAIVTVVLLSTAWIVPNSATIQTVHLTWRERLRREGVERLVHRATGTVVGREELGSTLLSILEDEKTPAALRGKCARALGRIRYERAIPALIRLVDLEDCPNKYLEFPGMEFVYPCTRALGDFGIDAVPPLVRAYIEERNEKRRILLAFTLNVGKFAHEGSRYAKALALEPDDQQTVQAVLNLVGELCRK